jgi:hypothetical protein
MSHHLCKVDTSKKKTVIPPLLRHLLTQANFNHKILKYYLHLSRKRCNPYSESQVRIYTSTRDTPLRDTSGYHC